MQMTKLQMAELASKKIEILGLRRAQVVFCLQNLRKQELKDVLTAQGHDMNGSLCPGCGRPLKSWYDHAGDCPLK